MTEGQKKEAETVTGHQAEILTGMVEVVAEIGKGITVARAETVIGRMTGLVAVTERGTQIALELMNQGVAEGHVHGLGTAPAGIMISPVGGVIETSDLTVTTTVSVNALGLH